MSEVALNCTRSKTDYSKELMAGLLLLWISLFLCLQSMHHEGIDFCSIRGVWLCKNLSIFPGSCGGCPNCGILVYLLIPCSFFPSLCLDSMLRQYCWGFIIFPLCPAAVVSAKESLRTQVCSSLWPEQWRELCSWSSELRLHLQS